MDKVLYWSATFALAGLLTFASLIIFCTLLDIPVPATKVMAHALIPVALGEGGFGMAIFIFRIQEIKALKD